MDLSAETALRSETGYADTVKEAVKAAAVVLIGGCTVFWALILHELTSKTASL